MKFKSLSLIALAISFQAYSQTEYFVKLDNQTGKLEKIKKIDNVRWIMMGGTTADTKNSQYIFHGSDTTLSNSGNLYTLDQNGNVISAPPYPGTSSSSNISNIVLHNGTGRVYGLRWDQDESMEYFVSIDPTTGSFTILNMLPTVAAKYADEAVVDTRNNYYIFRGLDTGNIQRIYTIDINSATIKSSPKIIDTNAAITFVGLQYDDVLEKFYAFCWDNAKDKSYLANLNTENGEYSIIAEIPGINGPYGTTGHTYDFKNHYFIFRGIGQDTLDRIYTVDVQSGKVVYDPVIKGLTKENNLIYTKYFPNSTFLYGLLWEPYSSFIDDIESVGFTVYPNPFNQITCIRFQNSFSDIAVSMYDITGRLVKTAQAKNTSTVYLDRDGLTTGVYFVKMRVDDKSEKTVQIVVE